MGPESWWKASALLGLREENQLLVFSLLEHGRSSCKPLGESSSMDMSPFRSGEGFCLFGYWDCMGSDLGEVVTAGCPCTWGTLTEGKDWSNDDELPNKIL